jgi:hypothetical protein
MEPGYQRDMVRQGLTGPCRDVYPRRSKLFDIPVVESPLMKPGEVYAVSYGEDEHGDPVASVAKIENIGGD